jgi:hypothetical protein
MAPDPYYATRYVPEYEYLVEGIRDGFATRFNPEDFSWLHPTGMPFHLIFPMVSFTTTEPRYAAEHRANYGDYSVTMTPGWAARHGLRHIKYVTDGMPPSGLDPQTVYRKISNPRTTVATIAAHPDLLYMKPEIGASKGVMYNGRQHTMIESFPEQREWRYVAEADRKHVFPSQSTLIQDELNRHTAALPTKNRLPIEIDQVVQVVVETNSQVSDFVAQFPAIKSRVTTWAAI